MEIRDTWVAVVKDKHYHLEMAAKTKQESTDSFLHFFILTKDNEQYPYHFSVK